MAKRKIYDKYQQVVAYVENDSIYSSDHSRIGYIEGNHIVDSKDYGRILYTIHEDGTVTEGTGRKIVWRIDEDGTITDNYGKIGGSIDPPAPVAPSSVPDTPGCGCLVALILIGLFSVFVMPGLVLEMIGSAIDDGNYLYLLPFGTYLICAVTPALVLNLTGEDSHFWSILKKTYVAMVIGGSIGLFVGMAAVDDVSGTTVFGSLFLSLLFSSLPAVIMSIIFYAVREK